MITGLRKLPFPYKAALAISSDVDNTPSLEVYLAMMDFLNSKRTTPFGKGLGLETGNSFWFFNNTTQRQLSYFQGISARKTAFAPYCRDFWLSGHLDTLHTYGDFDNGGFDRKYAEKALVELSRYNIRIPVWINHGTRQNFQNVGRGESFKGAVPGSKVYHMDLTREIGCRYYWIGRLTHIIGQEAKQTPSVLVKQAIQTALEKTKYRHLSIPLFDSQNRLLLPHDFQDGETNWEFQRWVNAWGRETTLDIFDFIKQIRPKNIKTLIKNEGFMILYTHICENLSLELGLPRQLKENLFNIKRMSEESHLLVTTVSRLLKYCEVSHFVEYEVKQKNTHIEIVIGDELRTPMGAVKVSTEDLQGLTFYIPEPDKTNIVFKNKKLKTVSNPVDESHRKSIMIPWKPLEYPR
ncbi:MAG: hypothetical protein GXO92_04385 [FCB group bacterium]|nr:hypothetical protein [FCB group bacterium]